MFRPSTLGSRSLRRSARCTHTASQVLAEVYPAANVDVKKKTELETQLKTDGAKQHEFNSQVVELEQELCGEINTPLRRDVT